MKCSNNKKLFWRYSYNFKRKPNVIEIDRGKEFYNSIFQNFLNKNSIKHHTGISSLGAVFAERFNRTYRYILKRQISENGESNCIDVLSVITKQYNNRLHSSTKLPPIQASLKKNEGYVYQRLLDKRKKIKPKHKIGDLVRRTNLKRIYSQGDMTNWSYNLYEITENIDDTIPCYKIDQLTERYNEVTEKDKLNIEREGFCHNKSKLKLNQIASVHHWL